MIDVAAGVLEEFAGAARKAAEYGLMRCSSGNLSRRLEAGHMLVKTSRSWMADLTADDIALCRIADGAPLNSKKPSVEIGFHAGLLRTRADIDVVLHFQTPFATALACRDPLPADYFALPEVAFYIGPVVNLPYLLPGSPQLAEAVVHAMRQSNLAVLANHGQVTVGKTYEEAIQRAVFFELACEVIVRNGPALRRLTPEAVQELRALATGV